MGIKKLSYLGERTNSTSKLYHKGEKKTMTNAQILQQAFLYDMLCRISSVNPLEVYTDCELNNLKWIAVEEQDGRSITAIRNEMNRRVREQ
jgi:hypothetical protein